MKGDNKIMKKLLGTTLVGMSGLVLFSAVSLAAETGNEPTKSYESDVNIKFEAENPNTGTGPFADRLSFTWAPKAFEFGTQVADFGDKAEYELKNAAAGKQWIVVNDGRLENDPKAGKTWNVKVNMDEFKEKGVEDTTNAQKINGTLTINLDEVKQYNMGKEGNDAGTDIKPMDPNMPGAVTEFDQKPSDIFLGAEEVALVGTSLTIKPGESVSVMNQNADRTGEAIKQEGYATRLASSKVKFTGLTSDVVGKEFGTKLTWTLTRDGY